MKRRDLLKGVAALGSVVFPMGLNATPANNRLDVPEGPIDKDQLRKRKQARRRTRRIILNNDGNDILRLPVDGIVTPELFLNKRTSPLLGSHVDSIFYCDGVNDRYTHKSDVTTVRDDLRVEALHQQDTDPLNVIIGFCRQHHKEVFWSMRMNDTHDAASKELRELVRWKREHPECLMGKPGEKSPFLQKWSALNYGLKEVRDRVLVTIRDVVSRYDIDGIELDFFRHPIFFESQYMGGVASQDECSKMTQLLYNIREICDEVAKQRGKPILIAIRIPDSIAFSKAIGLDVITWLSEELIDVMSGAGYFKMEPWRNWAGLGRKYNVPVYAVFSERRISKTLTPETETEIERWRGEARIAWKAGVNGIYTFNRFDPHDRLFHELGDPALLEELPRVDEENYINPQAKGVVEPETWLKGARKYLKERE
ncbi:hypothetical protein [Parapedobacter sp. 10938]|uniref:hypothetical protein n=1 Tax=Parapedobacter flavus TaxID=3110225 RepID=UPI002DB984FB|nr:hypothetical protein [Parapedobacter sp. 10938]MEC3878973.1 hypothetical protein [Parapedobacter sp. 10938]